MAEAILVPQVGQDLTEAKVVAIHVKLGDTVKRGDIVAEVESEKANFEVEAFASGVVIALPYKAGDTATVLEPLMVLGEAGEAASAQAAPVAQPAKAEAVVAPQAEAATQVAQAAGGSRRSSPLARRIAQSQGLDIAEIPGTGPAQAVVLRDVEAWIAKKPAATPARPALQLVAGGGGPVRVLKSGTGPAVAFVHGFGGDLSAWRPLVGRLQIENPVVALDLPGHGAAPERAVKGFADLVDAVAAALGEAGHGSLHLVGHSLGAAIALGLTGRGDFDVRSLTLISPAGLGPTVDGGFVAGFLGARSEAALAAQMGRLVHDPASLPGALVRATLAAREDATLVDRQARVAEAVFEGSTQLFSVREELRRFEAPCRVVLGRRDTIIPAAETEAALPGHVALHRLDHVGHLPFVEAAALTARLVTEAVRSGD